MYLGWGGTSISCRPSWRLDVRAVGVPTEDVGPAGVGDPDEGHHTGEPGARPGNRDPDVVAPGADFLLPRHLTVGQTAVTRHDLGVAPQHPAGAVADLDPVVAGEGFAGPTSDHEGGARVGHLDPPVGEASEGRRVLRHGGGKHSASLAGHQAHQDQQQCDLVHGLPLCCDREPAPLWRRVLQSMDRKAYFGKPSTVVHLLLILLV